MGEDNTTALPLASLGRGETCAFLQADSITGCRAPRSCHSCLEVEGCMISTMGTCVSQADKAFDPSVSYERAIEEGLVLSHAEVGEARLRETQQWLFPAGRIRYCSTSDDVCRACRRANFWRGSTSYPDSRFCLGENNECVCIDVCERPRVTQADCSSLGIAPIPAPSRAATNSESISTAQSVWHAVIGAVIFAVVALGLLLRVRRGGPRGGSDADARREARRQRQETHRQQREARVAARGVDPLSLAGWETYRRELINKEATQLNSSAGENQRVDNNTGYEGAVPVVTEASTGSDRREEAATTHYIPMDDETRRSGTTMSSSATSDSPSARVGSQLAPLTAVRQHPVM